MTDGFQPHATAISTSFTDRVVVRGFDLSKDLIGKVTFTEHLLILLTGRKPGPELCALLDATLVAISEHGLTPSVQAARMTYSSAPDALQGAVAAGLLSCGSVVLGASEEVAKLLGDILRDVDQGAQLDDAVLGQLRHFLQPRRPLPGFGHRQHKDGDPRAKRLLQLSAELGTAGRNVAALEAIDQLHGDILGKRLPLNVTAAIPAVLLDAGFPVEVIRGVPLLARTGGLIAHLLEEKMRPIAFTMADTGAGRIVYDGAMPADETTSS
ncbi:citryl-CoA lyase [Rhizobium rhizogenes]|uniref:citryl-CoA lyase n=1 Tax=Rhizobium rhizogenes TaxID=359 RepID=UPI001571F51B|nr:citryl-CoA lyase [Rhizobium rhizogenes]NTI78532.1 citryl-CoA lyase [Rhizobium rhizogenes]